MHIASDTTAPGASQRARRLVAVPQAAIARAARAAQSAGPSWHVEIEGNVIRLFQGEPPLAKVGGDDQFARGLRVVP